MKVKCDHGSKFSNLSNWKEEAWKKIRASTGFELMTSREIPVRCSTNWALKPWFFFRLLLSNCLNWKIYCDDHTSLSSTTAVQIWIISYIFTLEWTINARDVLLSVDLVTGTCRSAKFWLKHFGPMRPTPKFGTCQIFANFLLAQNWK